MQVNASFSSFCHPTQVGLTIVFLSMGARIRLHLANCAERAYTCEPVWPPTASLRMEFDISKLALTSDSVWPGLWEKKEHYNCTS